jgi:hypothetical protein
MFYFLKVMRYFELNFTIICILYKNEKRILISWEIKINHAFLIRMLFNIILRDYNYVTTNFFTIFVQTRKSLKNLFSRFLLN